MASIEASTGDSCEGALYTLTPQGYEELWRSEGGAMERPGYEELVVTAEAGGESVQAITLRAASLASSNSRIQPPLCSPADHRGPSHHETSSCDVGTVDAPGSRRASKRAVQEADCRRRQRGGPPVSASASASAPASASASASWENEARAARLQQDERRRTTQLSDFLTATAAVIELRSAARTEMRHRMHPGLLPPRVTSTGLFTRQPRTAESETPYADQLLLSERMKDHQPPQQPHAGPPLILMHNPGCGGGFHNPYPIHDEPQPDGSEEHPYTLW